MSEQQKFDTGEVKQASGDGTLHAQSRFERRAARRAARQAGGGAWLGGLLLIGLGVLFLMQNMGYLTNFSNWWALFLLLPAAGTFSAGMGAYRRDGAWTQEAVGPMLATAVFVGLTAVFLFNLNLSLFGPILLIGAGLLLLFARR